MKVIDVRNVNYALPEGMLHLQTSGVIQPTRNGDAIVALEPVTTVYRRPTERVLFSGLRDANPFFHLYEGLWMLAGRNDVAGVAKYARNMALYSDDSKTLNGAYGYRWRHHFGGDQLIALIYQLRKDPTTRRAVLAMWDGREDGRGLSSDYPCNLAVHFQVAESGALNMTVFNRSNDIIWGAYGANAVHMSMLHEFVASAVGRSVGCYWQVSDNFHAYIDLFRKLQPLADYAADWYSERTDPYSRGEVETFPMVRTDWSHWLRDLALTINEGSTFGARDPFFTKIVVPMLSAHAAYRNTSRGRERFDVAREILLQMPDGNDWRKAAEEWIDRREAATRRAADDGVNYEAG